jgi:hypothetical protein
VLSLPRRDGEAELGPFEYLLVFLAIVLGLAVTDLCTSLNRLLDAGARVRWDWLSPLAAVVAFLMILTQWWSWFGAVQLAKGLTFEMFVLIVVAVVLLFLLAAASLPDAVEEGGVDLREYYPRVSRRYWLLFAAHYLAANAVTVWAQIQVQGARLSPSLLFIAVFPIAAVGLAFVRVRLLHAACLVALIGIYVVQFAGHPLGQ